MKGKWPLVLLRGVVVVVPLALIQGCAPKDPVDASTGFASPNLQCQDADYTVLPGQSVELKNPCPRTPGGTIDGQWEFGASSPLGSLTDTFETGTCPTPGLSAFKPGSVNGITVNPVLDTPRPSIRLLVADSPTPPRLPQVNSAICYTYATKAGDSGHGALFVSTVALTVTATATPLTLSTWKLNANPTGGNPPYSFAWTSSPSSPVSLSDPASDSPIATPSTTTTYTVKVTDSAGQTASASTIVKVGNPLRDFQLSVVGNPLGPGGGVSVTVGGNVCVVADLTAGFAFCGQRVLSGTPVLLNVTKFPAGTTKVSWTDNHGQPIACNPLTPTSCTFAMPGTDIFVTPVFSAPVFTLTVMVTTTGTTNAVQTISPLTPGIFCSASSTSCTAQYPSGTTVSISEISLTAVSWTGCDSVGPQSPTIPLSTCTVLMDKNRTVTAAF